MGKNIPLVANGVEAAVFGDSRCEIWSRLEHVCCVFMKVWDATWIEFAVN